MCSEGKKGTTFVVKIVYLNSVTSLGKQPYVNVLESKKSVLASTKRELNFHTKKGPF